MAYFWRALSIYALLILTQNSFAETPSTLVSLVLQGQAISGHVLHASKSQVVLLRGDGAVFDLNPSQATDYRRSQVPFTAYTAGQVSAQLQAELGAAFEVTGTGHYLVAHPRGQGNLWAERFEELYRETVQYFRVRGLQVQQPAFPLVAIVWPKQEQFEMYARRDGMQDVRGVLGYYSRLSNRVTLYDVTQGNPQSLDWQTNAETIIHEAVHQSAFNTGLHRRHGGSPAWIVEGLGTMFEAPGVHSSARHPHLKDRVNKIQLHAFQDFLREGRQSGYWARLVASDTFFHAAPLQGYAESWAFSFFLSETRPRQYAQLLALTASKQPFKEYTATERWGDFVRIFGSDVKHMEAQFLDYIDRLE